MFAKGGYVRRMQDGGMPEMAPAAMAPPVNPAAADNMSFEQAAMSAQQAGLDPSMMEGMLSQVATQFQDIDNAEDYEQVMNGIRGDQQPVEARYQELAGVVGQEDAMATPESVLTLLQPVMQIAAVDQGIGGLAEQQMDVPVNGQMAEGIMSMAMPAQDEMAMAGAEVPAQANFRYGGPVVAMADGGDPSRLAELYQQQRDVYRSLIDPAQQQAEMDQQKNMTKAQMLFDIAGTALAFASPGSRSGMSPAERLAEAAQETQLFDKISQRAGGLEAARQAQAKENRALDLAALQAASGLQAKEFEASLRPRTEQDVKGIPMSVFNTLSPEEQRRIMLGDNVERPTVLSQGAIAIDSMGNILADNTRPETQTYTLSRGQQVVDGSGNIIAENRDDEDKTFTLSAGQRVVDSGGNIIAEYEARPETYNLSPGEQVVDEAGNVIAENTSEEPMSVHNVNGTLVGVNRATGQTNVLFQNDTSELVTLNGQIVAVDRRTNTATPIFGEAELAPPDYRILRDSRNGLTTTIDISTASGRAAIDAANAANKDAGTTVFTIRTVPSDSTPQAKAYLVGKDTVLSYDGGRTYADRNGQIQSMPTEPGAAVPLNDTIAYDVMKNERIMARAAQQLGKLDEELGLNARGGTADNPTKLSTEETGLVRDALEAARKGTGPWSALGAAVDNVVGGFIPQARALFKNTQENRQYLRGLEILGRSALVVNPRFPVAEMERVGGLFPQPDAFFRSPESEALKLIELKSLALAQKRRNLEALSEGGLDASIQTAVLSNNFELDRLLSLLATVPDGRPNEVDPLAIESLTNTIRGGRK